MDSLLDQFPPPNILVYSTEEIIGLSPEHIVKCCQSFTQVEPKQKSSTRSMLKSYADLAKLINYFQFYRCGVEKYIHHPEIFQNIVKTFYHPFISSCADWDLTLFVQWISRQIWMRSSSYNYQYMVGLQFTANFIALNTH